GAPRYFRPAGAGPAGSAPAGPAPPADAAAARRGTLRPPCPPGHSGDPRHPRRRAGLRPRPCSSLPAPFWLLRGRPRPSGRERRAPAPDRHHDFIVTPRQPTEHTAIVDNHDEPRRNKAEKRQSARTERILSSTAEGYPQCTAQDGMRAVT